MAGSDATPDGGTKRALPALIVLVTLDDAVMFQVASFRSTVEAPPASVVKVPVRMDFPLRATLAVV